MNDLTHMMRRNWACPEGYRWFRKRRIESPEVAWQESPNAAWMLWLAGIYDAPLPLPELRPVLWHWCDHFLHTTLPEHKNATAAIAGRFRTLPRVVDQSTARAALVIAYHFLDSLTPTPTGRDGAEYSVLACSGVGALELAMDYDAHCPNRMRGVPICPREMIWTAWLTSIVTVGGVVDADFEWRRAPFGDESATRERARQADELRQLWPEWPGAGSRAYQDPPLAVGYVDNPLLASWLTTPPLGGRVKREEIRA